MSILAGIHLVHEEGAEPAALGLPRVPPGRQRVSAGRGAPAGAPAAGEGSRGPRLPHPPAAGGALSFAGASLRVTQFAAGRGRGRGAGPSPGGTRRRSESCSSPHCRLLRGRDAAGPPPRKGPPHPRDPPLRD